MYNVTHILSHLNEAINCCKSLLESHYTFGNQGRVQWLCCLAALLRMRFGATGREDDFAKIAAVEEANKISDESYTKSAK
jgi:hypothetical protein